MLSPKKFLLSIVTLFLICCGSSAQDPQPAWRNYNTDHGLPSSEVYVAMQDSKGYMWFGTDNGVSRFDGYSFQNYGPADGLQNNVVFDLQEDRQGRIWMMTMSGNAYYHEQDSIYPFQFNDVIQRFREYKDSIFGQHRYLMMGVHCYFDDADSSLYATYRNLGILHIKADGNYHLYEAVNPDALVVLELDEKLLYAYSSSNIEERRDFHNKLSINDLCAPIEFHSDTVHSFFPKGCELSSSAISGSIKKLEYGQFLFEFRYDYGLIKDQQLQWAKPVKNEITQIFEDQKGAIFFCQRPGSGAFKYDNLDLLEKGQYEVFLPDLSTINMSQDKRQGYWFTTSEKGVFYAPDLNFQIYDEAFDLSTSYISSFEEKDDSTLFVGLWNGNLFELNTRTHVLQKLPHQIPVIAYQTGGGITDIYYNKKTKMLWSGPILCFFDGFKWKYVKSTKTKFSDSGYHQIKKIEISNNENRLWINSASHISKVDLNSKTTKQLPHLLRSRYRIFSMYEDLQGQLWIGREDGLWQVHEDTLTRPKAMHPSFYHRIEAISQLPDSTFVIGTKGRGIVLWKRGNFNQIREFDGLTSEMIENIYVDENGVIWVGTLLGLNKITRRTDNTFLVENITMHHGLPSNEITKIEVINGEIWIGTTKGLVRFPYDHQLAQFSNLPFFEEVLVNDKVIDWENTDLTFSHQQNNISFQFMTINYRQNGKIPYRYRLSPAQEDWKETQNRVVSFPALDNGDFSFEVQSQNENGIWSESTYFRFIIFPAWWETWWAISLAFLSVTAIGFGVYKRRTRQLKKEIDLQKQMADVERQALRSQMNPHFIFNALNAIQGYIAKGDKLSANRFLSRFSKLIRSGLQHSRMTKVPLEDDIRNLKYYLELEQLRFKGSFDYHIDIEDGLDVSEITIPPMLVQPFVENAIIHGLAKKEGKGQIDLDFRQENGFLQITITDNGIGIEASKKEKAGLTSSYKSVGLTITKRRLEMLNGNGETGKVQFEEVKDKRGSVSGTKVLLRIPLEE